MKRSMLILAAAVTLMGAGGQCSTVPASVAGITAPVRATNADERAIKTAAVTFQTTLAAIDLLIVARVIVPGTPRALQIERVVHNAQLALNTAARAQRATNATVLGDALTDAEAATASLTELLKGLKQ